MGKKISRPAFQLIAQTFLFVLLVASCKKQSLSPIADDSASTGEQKGKPAPGPAVTYLSVTVNDAGNKITSDGGGNYTNGSQAVSAKFDEQGNFIFSAGKSGHGPSATYVRWMNINFDSPVVVYIPPPINGNDKVQAITTLPAAGTTFIPLQNLGVGTSQCVGLTGGSNNDWIMNFHRQTEDVPSSPSSYAVFTRTGTNTWTVSPAAGGCNSNNNVCALRNGPGTLYGYYNMPFSFTLTKL